MISTSPTLACIACIACIVALAPSRAAAQEPAAQEPSAQAVLEAADRILAPARYTAEVRMVARRPDGSVREYAYKVAKSDDDKLLLTFTAPSTLSGHAALRRGNELWRYVPSLKRVMRVSGRSDFESGDFRNADVLRLNLARDYAPKGMKREGDTLVLDLVATSEEAAYDAMRLTVRASDFMPLKEELFASSGKLLRVLECAEPKEFTSKNGTHRAPSVMRMTNAIAKGRSTEMTIVSLSLEKELPASMFQVESMGR